MPDEGYASGICSRCGRIIRRQRPAVSVLCDCYLYCPNDHTGKGAYTTPLEPYEDTQSVQSYGPLNTQGKGWGDTEHPLLIRFKCPICDFYSAETGVEVDLT